jgi:hypothetical protein
VFISHPYSHIDLAFNPLCACQSYKILAGVNYRIVLTGRSTCPSETRRFSTKILLPSPSHLPSYIQTKKPTNFTTREKISWNGNETSKIGQIDNADKIVIHPKIKIRFLIFTLNHSRRFKTLYRCLCVHTILRILLN